jgi:CBS domain-containing protein
MHLEKWHQKNRKLAGVDDVKVIGIITSTDLINRSSMIKKG